jgi:hypothetical protein
VIRDGKKKSYTIKEGEKKRVSLDW